MHVRTYTNKTVIPVRPELKATEGKKQNIFTQTLQPTKPEENGYFKAYIPQFLYKPPYGYPRKVDVTMLKQLGKNPYIFSVIKTLYDEITALDWKIQFKEDWGGEDDNDPTQYEEQRVQAEKFFENPNGNEESFEQILKSTIAGIMEVDAGLWVKVFNEVGELKHMLSRDGALFLKNPDIYGYMGDRADFVPPIQDKFFGINVAVNAQDQTTTEMIKQYDYLFKQRAAYFQYGWTAGSMPIPFGRREIVYIMANPRPDSIYGRSPLEILATIIESLVYGSEFNLDFYTNNNIPDGVIELLGAEQDHIEQFRDGMENQFMFTDVLGKRRKKFFKMPISSVPVKFVPFTFNAKDMQVLEQQKWFIKLVWACFGVTAEEMGFTEDSNKAVAETQTKVNTRKGIKPLKKLLEYHINTQVLPEFFVGIIKDEESTDEDPDNAQLPDFKDIPIEFVFDEYDYNEDMQKHTLLEQEIRMGIKTPEMAAEELGIDLVKLKESKAALVEEQVTEMEAFGDNDEDVDANGNEDNDKKPFGNDKESKDKKDNSKDKKEIKGGAGSGPKKTGSTLRQQVSRSVDKYRKKFKEEHRRTGSISQADKVATGFAQIKAEQPAEEVDAKLQKDTRTELQKLDSFIDNIEKGIVEAVEKIPETQLYDDVKE